MTALHLAAKSGLVEVVRTLLQTKHVDINVKVAYTHTVTDRCALSRAGAPCHGQVRRVTDRHIKENSDNRAVAIFYLVFHILEGHNEK